MNASLWNIDFSRLFNDPSSFFQELYASISQTTLIAYGILAFLLIWGIILTQKYLSMGKGSRFDPHKEAQRALKTDPFRAAELFEQAGDPDQAIKVFKEVKAYQQVARIYEEKREWETAAQFYKLAGDPEKSAVMYQKGGEYARAAEAYLSCKKTALAAEMYEKGKRYREAATQYEKFGNMVKAATLYEQAHDFEKAAEAYERHFMHQKMQIGQAGAGLNSEKLKEASRIAQQSGLLFLKAKKYQKAMEIFSAGGFPSQAAEAAEAAGDIAKAAELYIDAKAFGKAADMYAKLGDSKQGALVMARKYQEEGAYLPAAEAYEKGERWSDAADMYDRAGEETKAGAMFMKGGDYHHASQHFLAAGDEVSAAHALEKGGRFKEAAELYTKLELFDRAAVVHETIGDHYQAAILLKRQEKVDESISALQRVDSRSGDYYHASLLLGQLLMDRGMIDAARERYQKIVTQEPIAAHNLEIYYQLALIYEKKKEFEEAQGFYEKILAEDFTYKDVKSRSDLLKKALTEVKKAMEASRIERPVEKPAAPIIAEAPARYKILKKIGQGGMGVVYQAEDTILKRIVAYKILPTAIRENEAVLQNFLQEARIAAALNHPNVVTLFDTGKNKQDIFITMEFVDGINLKEHLEKNKPHLPELIDIMKEICQGVAYAHSKNVVHRDLKPANVMLAKDHKVKIMDFGLAKVISETMADKTSVKGTPLYMAPEQILGEKVDQQSDIYSLGCTFYRMVTGVPPFTQGDVYYHHLHTPPVPPRQHNPKLSPDLEKIILRSIEKEKAKRYKKVAEVIYDLERIAKL